MTLSVVPLEEQHLPEAARLLAARQRAHRVYAPELPVQFEDPAFNISYLQGRLKIDTTVAVVALHQQRVVGYLLGRTRVTPPGSSAGFSWHPRSVSMPSEAHAVDPEFYREAFPAMYAALSPRWVAAGLFSHYVNLPAQDRAALDTWFSLTFGLTWTYAVRDTRPLRESTLRATPGLLINRAEPRDCEPVLNLLDDLYRHHARPPCFLPCMPDTAAGFRVDNAKALSDPGTVCWVARHQGEVAGVLVVTLPAQGDELVIGKPERCPYIHLLHTAESLRGMGIGTALVNQMLAWARAERFSCCSLEWHMPNLAAASFWQRCEFRPVRYMLCRQLDERIAWAHA